ncbi:MAG TPA: porin [Croceibacterium sp.]|nr:porin [Croceibacterium sp.]
MRSILAVLLAGSAVAAPVEASAQAIDINAVQEQLAEMQAEIARLTAQVAELQAREDAREAAAPPPPPPPPPPSAPAAAIAWKGAPEITGAGGWSFKPRGRVQVDTAVIDAPDGIAGQSLGSATEFRRAYIGFEGAMPGGFAYRMEADIAGSSVELTDVYLAYKASQGMTLTLGQHKPFGGLDELTSDVFLPFMERAAFNSAFGFERRVGFSGTYVGDKVIAQLGVFTDNAADLNADSNDSFSLDGRVVFAPKLGRGQWHIAGSAHVRDLNDASATVRYRARPFLHTTDLRLVDTRAFSAVGERNFGVELAYIDGPFHATLEGHQMSADRPGLPDPTFRGGYAEVGMLLTPGDRTAYRNGAFDRIRPARPITAGGIGAIQVNARYDYLDLTDGAIVGGTQQTAGLSVIWIPTEYIRFLANYGHLWIDDAAVLAGIDPSYQADTLGFRAQVDF